MTQRTIVGIGAGRGLGRASVMALSDNRPDLPVYIGWANNEASADATVADLRTLGRQAEAVRVNVLDAESVSALGRRVGADGGKISDLVVSTSLGKWAFLVDVPQRALRKVVDAMGCPLVTVPLLLEDQLATECAITGFSSHGSTQATVFYGAMGIAKAMLEESVRWMDEHFCATDVRVNALRSWIVDTESFRMAPGWKATRVMTELRTPLGRMLTLDDIATTVRELHHGELSTMRGSVLTVDGGVLHTII